MAHTGDKRATAAAQAGNAASLGADHETNVIALIQCEPALEAQALLRMRNMPYRVVNTGHSWFMSTGTLPQLRQGCDLAGAARIGYKIARTTSDGSGASLADSMLGASAKLGDLTRSLDAELESKHLSQIVAFSALVERVLGDVLLFCRYALDEVYESSTKPALLRQAPFPVSYAFAWSRRREVLAHLAAVGMTDLPWVKLQATAAYASLAELMVQRPDKSRTGSSARKGGAKKFFMGNTPCSLDAKVWGHLASIQDTPAWAWASRHSALKQLYRRVTDTWFTKAGDLPQYLHEPITGIHKYTSVGKNFFTMLNPPADALRTPTLPPTDDGVIASKVNLKIANHKAAIDRMGPPPKTPAGEQQVWWNSYTGRGTALAVGLLAIAAVGGLGYAALARTPSVFLPDNMDTGVDAAAASASAAAAAAVATPHTVVAAPIMMPSSLRVKHAAKQ